MRTSTKRSASIPWWATACSPALRFFSPALRRARRDEGFSVIEIVVALGLFSVIATFTSHLLVGGMTGVLLGKRREVATQEANRIMEIARSLSYDAIGLVQTDPTIPTDAAIQEHNGSPSYLSGADWEPLILVPANPTHPFNPHVQAVQRGSTKLTHYVYVTGVDSDGDDELDLKRVSVRVTWDDSGTSGPANEVRAQTLVNASGLVVKEPLTADTLTTAGSLNIKTGRGSVTGLVDATLSTSPASFALPTTTGHTKYRAVSDVTCAAKSAQLVGATKTYGGHPVSVTADDNGATATGENPAAQSWSGSPPDQINGLEDVDKVLVESAITSPVSCQATAADSDGLAPTDDALPYEKGTASALGALNLTENLSGLGLPSDTLTAVNVTSAPISQEIDHQNVAEQREVYANSAASMGLLQAMKIPSVFPEGLVRVDALNYSASVRGSGSTPSAAPSVSAPTINMRVYDVGNEVTGCTSRNSGYCLITVNPGASGFLGLSIDYEHSVLQNLGLTELVYEVHVDILPPAKDPLDGVIGPNGERRWSAEYTPIVISSRLRTNLTVPLVGDVMLTDTQVDLNLGGVSAKACAGPTCL